MRNTVPELFEDTPPYYDHMRGESLELGVPITDSRPFLYFTSWDEVRPLIYGGAALFTLLALLAAFVRPRKRSLYFSFIGTGYILSELYLLAVFRSALGGYSTTFAAILAALSVAAAAGALLWEHYDKSQVVLITIGGFLAAILSPYLLQQFGHSTLAGAFFLLTASLPLGFALGLYLPAGLKHSEGRAALFWGIDAIGTALGFVLFFLISLAYGFHAAIALAVFCYLSALLLWPNSS